MPNPKKQEVMFSHEKSIKKYLHVKEQADSSYFILYMQANYLIITK